MSILDIPGLAQDLYDKLNAMPSLAGKVGLTSGGKGNDPALTQMPLPGAWAVFRALEATDPSIAINPRVQTMQCKFSVMLFIAYGTQSDLIATQYPIFVEVVKAIRGTEAPNETRWHFDNANVIMINPDRLGYELAFSASITI